MFNYLIDCQRLINIALFTFVLATNLIADRVNAEHQSDIELRVSNNFTDKKNTVFTQSFPLKPTRDIPNLQDTNIPTPIIPLQKPDINDEESDTPTEQNEKPILQKKDLEIFILNALTNSAIRYPWIIDPRDNFTFYSAPFNPIANTKYIEYSLKFSTEDPVFNRFTFANFPKQDQFYWVLPGNRVVIETKGWQSGVTYQGATTNTQRRESIRLTQRLWGMQAVSSLPQGVQELTQAIGTNQFTIESIAAEVINPVGVETAPVVINSRGNPNNSISSVVPNVSSLSTDQYPLILQNFPTSNLQPLLGEVTLTRGEIISPETLQQAGFTWGNPVTGQKTQFQAEITSYPGIKVGNREEFGNVDLYNILLNQSISTNQRSSYYLNSLYWVTLGESQSLLGIRDKIEQHDWHRFYLSYSHNRTLLEYDPLEAKATYTNIATNPGVSLSLSFSERQIDKSQTAKSTLGMLLGSILELIDFSELEASLHEAKERYSRQDNFAVLDSKATPEQRRQINQILNRTLYLGNQNSGLEQVSGILSFPSTITLNSSSIFQIRTGNHRRLVQVFDGNRTWRAGETFISKADVSNQSFGPLSSVSIPIPSQQTPNRSSAVQVTLTAPNGQQFIQNLSSANLTSFPINVRAFDMAFDRIELSQDGKITNYFQAFDGYLYLPTIEALWAAASGNWNYGISSGMWLNLNTDTAFNITNNLGILEPTLGIYFNGVLNYISTHVAVDAEGRTESITNHIPSLQLYWNSEVNFLNPAYLNMSYLFSHQNRNLNYSLSTAILFLDNQFSITPVGLFQGKLGFNTGLEFSNSLEIRGDLFYTLEGLQQVSPQWAFGAYLQNFKNTERDTGNRVADFTYGLLLRRNIPGSGNFWQSRIGMSGDNFEALFQGGFRF
ncbi:hypothetical protein [Anabaena sp. CA = ATCC 33047]|uniref:hypothetical protein n=1 Tax=Anabaena sp. (strain CA / ATCC 33047) TaxID=52271 RepID=UPI0008355216|nr:hypothetical protein [Anabaena sp. CA = ATCC 33047]